MNPIILRPITQNSKKLKLTKLTSPLEVSKPNPKEELTVAKT